MMIRTWLLSIIQLTPLYLFFGYAVWTGEADNSRWIIAYKISSIAALLGFIVLIVKPRPANRFILAIYTYLILGGLAAYSHQWWLLRIYKEHREAALIMTVLVIGIFSTLFSKGGFLGVVTSCQLSRAKASSTLLITTLCCLAFSINFTGNTLLAGYLPFMLLLFVQRYLSNKQSSMENFNEA